MPERNWRRGHKRRDAAAGTWAQGCGGAGMWRRGMRRGCRERKGRRAGEDAGREMLVGPLNGPFPHSSHFMSTDLLFFSFVLSICACILLKKVFVHVLITA